MHDFLAKLNEALNLETVKLSGEKATYDWDGWMVEEIEQELEPLKRKKLVTKIDVKYKGPNLEIKLINNVGSYNSLHLTLGKDDITVEGEDLKKTIPSRRPKQFGKLLAAVVEEYLENMGSLSMGQ